MFKVNKVSRGFKSLRYYGEPIPPNTLVYVLSGCIYNQPTRTSIQIGPDQHIEDQWGQYINHKCDPSVRVINNKLISSKRINDGDHITFNYNESEDIMANPFMCNCCDKIISGKLSI